MQNLNDICTSRCTYKNKYVKAACLLYYVFCVVRFTVTYLCIQSKCI